jgi:8-oxo-dGTP pyrophosphatase MutT (NUDIX family)
MAANNLKQGCGALICATTTKRYLFLHRCSGKFSSTWGLVGGKIEHHESIEKGLLREISEELGGIVKDAKIIPIEQYTSDSGIFVYHTFLIQVDDEFIPFLNTEHSGYCWTTLNSLPRPLHPGVEKTLGSNTIKEKLRTIEQSKIEH